LEAADIKGLLGLLLVDGSLNQYRTPRGGYVQLTLTGGVTEAGFLAEKVDEFRQFIPTKAEIVPYRTAPRYSKRRDKNGVLNTEEPKHTVVLRFRVSTNKLRPVYNLLYPDGNREITQAVLDMLGAGAAAWTWAEGGRNNKDGSAELARCGTSQLEAERISKWLELLTGAKSTIPPFGGELDEFVKPRLAFDAENAKKLRQTLYPYAPITRRHVFDECPVHESSPELVPGERQDQSAREQAPAMA
jgi:hypothetical protein